MQNLTVLELQHLKCLINIQDVNYQKFSNYSDYAVDPQIKQIFNQYAQDSLNVKQKLLNFFT